ncbi:hypothetical protein [Nocardia brasiliensis]|uniref:hypothetical protein n=1 Tax=Nocardia brasiliensis TaxID=37326 RepID=UPI0024574F28|nr:hypothetical protein [Nocardia brasiliensis]
MELVAQVNMLLLDCAPSHSLVSPTEWPESVTALLDRMAAAAARAREKHIDYGPSDPTTREAWARLAALESQYERIVGGVVIPLAG